MTSTRAVSERLEEAASQLIEILVLEKTILHDLITTSQKERRAVVQNAVNELSQLIDIKEELVGRMARHEQRRSKCATVVAAELGIPAERATIATLADHLPSAMSNTLRALHGELQSDVEDLKRLTSANALLLESCLGAIQTSLFFLTHLSGADVAYNNDGRLAAAHGIATAAISRRA